jgi:hypothetical protein
MSFIDPHIEYLAKIAYYWVTGLISACKVCNETLCKNIEAIYMLDIRKMEQC